MSPLGFAYEVVCVTSDLEWANQVHLAIAGLYKVLHLGACTASNSPRASSVSGYTCSPTF
jgi:hypothetical protein